jgi:hypothetical protein
MRYFNLNKINEIIFNYRVILGKGVFINICKYLRGLLGFKYAIYNL